MACIGERYIVFGKPLDSCNNEELKTFLIDNKIMSMVRLNREILLICCRMAIKHGWREKQIDNDGIPLQDSSFAQFFRIPTNGFIDLFSSTCIPKSFTMQPVLNDCIY